MEVGEIRRHPIATQAMFISESSTRAELEAAIVSEKALYGSFDETLLLNGGYTTAQLFEAVTAWIESGDECASA